MRKSIKPLCLKVTFGVLTVLSVSTISTAQAMTIPKAEELPKLSVSLNNYLINPLELVSSLTESVTADEIVYSIEAETQDIDIKPTVEFETNEGLITQAEQLKDTADSLHTQATDLNASIKEELERLKQEREAREAAETEEQLKEVLDTQRYTHDEKTRIYDLYTEAGKVAQAELSKEPSGNKSYFNAFIASSKIHKFENYDARTKTNLTGVELERFLEGTSLAGLGHSYALAEKEYGISSMVLLALSAHESAWGNSRIARDKNNLFGYMAYDNSPYASAKQFETREDAVMTVASHLSRNYLTRGAKYFNGYTLADMNIKYASDPDWNVKITSIMNRLVENF